jgi:hypothetical protein
MTGLDLESFLLLLRADITTWVVLGLATVVLALMVWSCWRSRRAVRNCLVLSLAAHLGLALYGSTIPAVMWTLGPDRRDLKDREHLRQIRVAPLADSRSSNGGPSAGDSVRRGSMPQRWDVTTAALPLADGSLQVDRPSFDDRSKPVPGPEIQLAPLPAVASALPKSNEPVAVASSLEVRPDLISRESGSPTPPSVPLPLKLAEDAAGDTRAPIAPKDQGKAARTAADVSPLSLDPALGSDRRLRPDREPSKEPGRSGTRFTVDATAGSDKPSPAHGPESAAVKGKKQEEKRGAPVSDAMVNAGDAIPLARATPSGRASHENGPGLAPLGDRGGGPSLAEIPRIYQPRLVPDRSVRAQRIGASAASELAVERALDWLMRHQDEDGRWDGGVARYDDGTPVNGDDDFTAHCPAGEPCRGECAYWEADTALTGLALLTYLGAGYTHTDGRYARVVGKGIDFLIAQQKTDGDLRGRSQVVGMYCHAMASLALCEAFALTGDDRLRSPSERAIAFLVRARARDGMAWRYAPGAPAGDTSILGWVVLGLKSAREVGIPIPDAPAIRRGTLLWLEKIAAGRSRGLGRYQPSEPVTPTMTAEAWVCRQFLGVGGPGPASSEAAEFLLQNDSDRGKTNFYYWYYATLALYQHGGEPWTKWNARIRDKIVGLQATSGHQTGSWAPDTSLYGGKGGRIYCTTLAALSLEVYYRYLRLYDEPTIPLEAGASSKPAAERETDAVPKTAAGDSQPR